ncbi:MAG: TlpA disulfide reductase family protein [Candidatus Wallbacteria bacterium]|nr:TlpA disulfide reductase family protein [Candidatus Wallbacteria bacterium]
MNIKNCAIALLIIALALWHYSFKKLPDEDSLQSEAVAVKNARSIELDGALLPETRVTLLTGEKLDLADEIGKKVIIINYFASWCPPCKAELPDFQVFYEKHRQEQLLFLGISTDQPGDRGKLEEVLKKAGVTYPVGFPDNRELLNHMHINSIPVTLIVNIHGKISSIRHGRVEDAEAAFGTELRANLAGLKRGLGITREQYLDGLAKQTGSVKKEWKKGGFSISVTSGSKETAESGVAASPVEPETRIPDEMDQLLGTFEVTVDHSVILPAGIRETGTP